MTAKDEVAGLPAGAGAGLANDAEPAYVANPDSLRAIATDLTNAASTADGCNQAVNNALGELHGWTGDAAEAFRGYMARFTDAGNATHAALTAGASAINQAAQALSDGKVVLEQVFERILTDYRNNYDRLIAQYPSGAGHPTDEEHDKAEEEAAQKAVVDNSAAVANEVNTINSALATAASAVGTITNELPAKFSSLNAPGGPGLPARSAPPIAVPTSASSFSGHAGNAGGYAEGSSGGGYSGGGMGASGGPPDSQPPGNVQEWIQEAIQVLEQNGVPAGALNANDIWTIIQHESGGNPNSINLWDTNAQAGHPSKGLMQTIDSTFNSYKLPDHDNIYSPVDNIIAGVRYALSRYGSIENVPGIRAVHGGGHYVGY